MTRKRLNDLIIAWDADESWVLIYEATAANMGEPLKFYPRICIHEGKIKAERVDLNAH